MVIDVGELKQVVQLQDVTHALGFGPQWQPHVEVADMNVDTRLTQRARQKAAFKAQAVR